MDFSKEHDRKGLVATILIHSIIFLLLLVWVMAEADNMVDQAGGVEVSFGDPTAGGPENISQVSETQPQPSPSSPSPSQPNPVTDDPVVTNDQSDAPEVQNTQRQTTQTQPTDEVQKPKEEEQPKINESLAERLKRLKEGRKNSETTSNGGGGDNSGPKGQPDANKPGRGGNATSGTMGNMNFNLTGFGIGNDPGIVNNSQEDGIVTVQVCLDKRGNLQSSRYMGNKSTTTSKYLIDLSLNAIKRIDFVPIGNQAESNCGTISFNYALQ